MAFNYEKNKQSHSGDSFWTSYSDLFLGLSCIFLLLYVTSSLRTGTDAIQAQAETQKLTMKVEELNRQLEAYESIKKDYMETAPKDEQQEYKELMDKLVLLQDEAKSERDRLAQESNDNQKKAVALNKYQQMIRNIMNANKVGKSRIATRDDIIVDKNAEIDKQKQDLAVLEGDVATKQKQLAESQAKIDEADLALAAKKKQLHHALESNKITKSAYKKQVQTIEQQNAAKLAQLKDETTRYTQQLSSAHEKLTQLNQALASTQNQLDKTGAELNAKAGEADALKSQIAGLKSGFEKDRANERAAFEGKLKKEKLNGAERARREAAFRAAAEKKANEVAGKLAGLQGKLKDTEGALSKAKEEIDARKAIAAEIKNSFARAGVKADVDMGTGEVILDFGDAYFENGSANLSGQMKTVLQKAMPAYGKSLFSDSKLASKIGSVEIIGFASPTFQGRFIDPNSTAPADREALKYNMDLSYRRANAIFQYLLDGKAPDFEHQHDLLALMKVSGRSFLETMKVQSRNVANAADFCRLNDCKKAQRVIIRFSMDGKKK
jgi:outer membrane protein OmpA-like peptidoglycan-associated protein